MEERKLWVDDLREPPDDSWEWVDNYIDGMAAIANADQYDFICLDHDLGISMKQPDENTTYPMVLYMAREDKWPRKGIFIVTDNSFGLARLKDVITKYSPFTMHGPRIYTKNDVPDIPNMWPWFEGHHPPSWYQGKSHPSPSWGFGFFRNKGGEWQESMRWTPKWEKQKLPGWEFTDEALMDEDEWIDENVVDNRDGTLTVFDDDGQAYIVTADEWYGKDYRPDNTGPAKKK